MGEAVRSSPLALASPFGRRGDTKGDSEAVASYQASRVSSSGVTAVMGHGRDKRDEGGR